MSEDNPTLFDWAEQAVEYRSVPEFPGYRVGNDGSVWTCWQKRGPKGACLSDQWKVMKPTLQKNRSSGRAYLYLNLVRDGKPTTFFVHRLVLEAFVGHSPEGMEGRHLDGNPLNCRKGNLAWGTPEQNRDDNHRLGRYSETPRNRRYTHDGKTLCLKDWAKLLNVNYGCLYYRLFRSGMTFQEAISKPFLGIAGNGKNERTRPSTGLTLSEQ